MVNIDKSWMDIRDRGDLRYMQGVNEFLDWAFHDDQKAFKFGQQSQLISCPCRKCFNVRKFGREEVWTHLLCDGIYKQYRVWSSHVEDVGEMLHDLQGYVLNDSEQDEQQEQEENPNIEAQKFYKLLEDAEAPLYADCKNMSKLSASSHGSTTSTLPSTSIAAISAHSVPSHSPPQTTVVGPAHSVPQIVVVAPPHSFSHIAGATSTQCSSHTVGTASSSIAETSKRGRGTSKCEQLMRLREGEQLDVTVIRGCGVGLHGDLFTSFQGMLGRMHCDLWQKDFKKTLTEEKKERIFRDLTRYFKFARTPEEDGHILSKIGEIHCKHRGDLKRIYFMGRSFEEAVVNVPEDVDVEQWKMVCEYWNRKEQQDIVLKNKTNRTHLGTTYKRGRTSINQIRDKFRREEGRDPTRPEIFQITHCRKSHDGSQVWVDEQSRQQMERMSQLMTPTEDSDATGPVVSADEAFVQVMGPDRPGRVRCAGRGETLRSWYGGISHERSTSHYVHELESQISELKNALIEQQEIRDSRERALKEEMKAEMDSMRTMFTAQLEVMKAMMLPPSPP